ARRLCFMDAYRRISGGIASHRKRGSCSLPETAEREQHGSLHFNGSARSLLHHADQGRAAVHIDVDVSPVGAVGFDLGLGAVGVNQVQVIAFDGVPGHHDIGGHIGHSGHAAGQAGHGHDPLAVVQLALVDAQLAEVGGGIVHFAQTVFAVDVAALAADDVIFDIPVGAAEAGHDLGVV